MTILVQQRTSGPTRAIPEGYQPVTKDGVDAVVYIADINNLFYALGFIGQRQRPKFHLPFTAAEKRDAFVEQYFTEIHFRHGAFRAQRQRQQAAFSHDYTIGDILVSTWGYEQTNVTWYQVVRVPGPKSIEIRCIEHGAMTYSTTMSGTVLPKPDAFKDEPITKRVRPDGTIKVDHAVASRWDGKPKFWSSYA